MMLQLWLYGGMDYMAVPPHVHGALSNQLCAHMLTLQALKEEGAIEEAERAFARLLALDTPESGPNIQAMRVIAQMRQQQGRHARAIEVLDKAIGYGKDEQVNFPGKHFDPVNMQQVHAPLTSHFQPLIAEAVQICCLNCVARLFPCVVGTTWSYQRNLTQCSQMVELLYLRAICHHALGNAREAVEDYERCLTYQRPHGTTGPALTEEARSFQYLSFYQKEVCR